MKKVVDKLKILLYNINMIRVNKKRVKERGNNYEIFFRV